MCQVRAILGDHLGLAFQLIGHGVLSERRMVFTFVGGPASSYPRLHEHEPYAAIR